MLNPFTIYRNPNPRHHADFADVCVAANGDVTVILRQCGLWAHDATFRFSRPLTFFEARAEILLLRSTDTGRTFLPERSLHTGLAYDPMLYTLTDGRMLAGMVVGEAGPRRRRAEMQGVLHRHLPHLDTVITVRGVALWASTDNGFTWSAQPKLVSPPGWENTYNLRKPLTLFDGTIIMPMTIGYPWRSRYIGLIRSWDDGETWSDPSYVAEDPDGRAHYSAGFGYWQPAMAAAPDGDLLCVCVLDDRDSAPPRSAGASSTSRNFGPTSSQPALHRTHSVDSGFTWSVPQDTGLVGDFPSITVLPDERFLLTRTERRPGCSAVLANTSGDGGVSWSEAQTVCESADHRHYYPNTVVLPDGDLLTVFTATQPDQVRTVEGVRWSTR